MYRGHNSKEVLIQNISDMDKLETKLIDLLGDSPSSMDEAALCEFLYAVSRKNLVSLPYERYDYYRRAYIDILMEQGWTLKKEDNGSYQMASNAFKKALSLDPCNPLAHYRLGHIISKSNKKVYEALFHFLEALKQTGQKKESKYKLSLVQVANAEGMAIKLFTEVMGSVSLETPESKSQNLKSSILTLKNLVQNVSNQVVIHFEKHNGFISERSLTVIQYGELVSKLENNSCALVLDKFVANGSMNYAKSAECDPSTMDRLLALLEIDRFSAKDLRSKSGETLLTHMSRLRAKLKQIGLQKTKFNIVVPPKGTPYCETSLDIHYFKNIFD